MENELIPCSLQHQCCETHVQAFLFLQCVSQRLCLHLPKGGRITEEWLEGLSQQRAIALAGEAVGEQCSAGPYSFRRKAKD